LDERPLRKVALPYPPKLNKQIPVCRREKFTRNGLPEALLKKAFKNELLSNCILIA